VLKVNFAEDDHMVETFRSDRANDTFNIVVLLG
jgi:hypothetical protein